MKNSFKGCPLAAVFFALTLGFSACTTFKQPLEGRAKRLMDTRSATFLQSQVADSAFQFLWLSGKLNVQYTDNKNTNSFSVNLRMRKDSVIWISASKMGIEAAQIKITPDSLFLVNRLNSTYARESIKVVADKLGVSLTLVMLQNALLGNHFDFIDLAHLKIADVDRNFFSISTFPKRLAKKAYEEEGINQMTLLIEPATFRINTSSAQQFKPKVNVDINYSDYRRTGRRLMPWKVDFFSSEGKNVQLNLEYTKVTLDNPLEIPFRIPKSYTRVRF